MKPSSRSGMETAHLRNFAFTPFNPPHLVARSFKSTSSHQPLLPKEDSCGVEEFMPKEIQVDNRHLFQGVRWQSESRRHSPMPDRLQGINMVGERACPWDVKPELRESKIDVDSGNLAEHGKRSRRGEGNPQRQRSKQPRSFRMDTSMTTGQYCEQLTSPRSTDASVWSCIRELCSADSKGNEGNIFDVQVVQAEQVEVRYPPEAWERGNESSRVREASTLSKQHLEPDGSDVLRQPPAPPSIMLPSKGQPGLSVDRGAEREDNMRSVGHGEATVAEGRRAPKSCGRRVNSNTVCSEASRGRKRAEPATVVVVDRGPGEDHRRQTDHGSGNMSRSCAHEGCSRRPSFGVEGSKAGMYCVQHAEHGMLNVARRRCGHESCRKVPSFGAEGSRSGVYCREHAKEGMVDVVSRRCAREGCSKAPRYGVEGSKTGMYCRQHAEHGMIDVVSKRCAHMDCNKVPCFGVEGSKSGVYCQQHADDGMINVVGRHCAHESCSKRPRFGVEGSKSGMFCGDHAEEGMVNVVNKRCTHEGCSKYPCFGVEGSKPGVYCRQHAKDGMVNVVGRRCANQACGKVPKFGTEGSRSGMYCKQHAEDGMVDVVTRRCAHEMCSKKPSFAAEGRKSGLYCRQHAKDGMVDVLTRRCANEDCTKIPCFGVEGSKFGVYCRQHAELGMVDVVNRRCAHEDCSKAPNFGTQGSKSGVYCKQHAGDDMVDVVRRSCAHEGCNRQPRFGAEGSKSGVFCSKHAEDGMANVYSKRCAQKSCRKVPRFGPKGGRAVVYCQQHAERGMVTVPDQRPTLHDELNQGNNSYGSQGRAETDDGRPMIHSNDDHAHGLNGRGAAISLPKRLMSPSVGTPLGDGDHRHAEARDTGLDCHGEMKWRNVKVETNLSTG